MQFVLLIMYYRAYDMLKNLQFPGINVVVTHDDDWCSVLDSVRFSTFY